MIALIAGNDEALGLHLQSRLALQGVTCTRGHVVTPEQVAQAAAKLAPDLVLTLCPGNFSAALELVRLINSLTPATLIAVGERFSTAQILETIRAGASDYLERSGDLDAEIRGLAARWKSTRSVGAAGQLIGVLSAAGGAGTSTLAANLAALWAKDCERVCLLDWHPHGGDQAALFDLRPQHTMAEVCEQGARLDAAMFQQALARHASNVFVLAAPPLSKDVTVESLSGWDHIWPLAKGSFPRTLVDLPLPRSEHEWMAVQQCGRLVVVLRLDLPTIMRTRWLVKRLVEFGRDPATIRLVVNRQGRRQEVPRKKAGEALSAALEMCLPDDDDHVLAAANLGNPVVREYPQCPFARSLAKWAAALAT